MSKNIEIALEVMGYYYVGEAVKYKQLFKYAPKYELIDRLYRKYVRYEDINATKELVQEIFEDIALEKSAQEGFIAAYDKCIDAVKYYVEEDGKPYGREDGRDDCPPIRIVNVTGVNDDEIPEYIFYSALEGQLPLEEYDNLDGNPFWMRPEYLNERVIANTPHEMLVTKEARRLYGFEDVSLELLKKLGIPVID